MRPKLIANLSVASIATVALVVAATRSDGYHATNVDLNDGTVWVTNTGTGQVARLNIAIDELDFGVMAAEPDVVQDGRDVYAADASGMFHIDVVTGASGQSGNTIDPVDYQIGGGVGLLFDRDTGRLWTGSSRTLVAPEYPRKADGQLGAGTSVVLTGSGTVLAVDRQAGTWFEIGLDDQLKPIDPTAVESAGGDESTTTTEAPAPAPGESIPEEIEAIVPVEATPLPRTPSDDAQITAVGDRLVFLEPDGAVFGVDGDVAEVPGTTFVLQAPGPDAGRVLVASDEGLFAIGVGSSDVQQLSDQTGQPAQPVRVGACAYGAWTAEVSTWFRDCPGRKPLDDRKIPGATEGELRFRVNQSNVALNQTGSGGVWTEHDGRLVRVDNWGDVDADDANNDVSDTGTETQDDQEVVCVTDARVPPVATDDPEIGLRNRQTVIDVLYNDTDANCEPIAVVEVSAPPSDLGSIRIIDNGQHLLFDPGPGVVSGEIALPQPFVFTYVIGDSAGDRSAPATATALITDPTVATNRPPQLRETNGEKHKMRTVVESGRLARYNVLADWYDPDGDELRLVDATSTSGLGEVSYSPDGMVRYGAYGVGPGIQQISVRVSDGQATQSEGSEQLEITVLTDGQQIKPEAHHDFITLTEGRSGIVLPLANDYDGNDDALTLQLAPIPEGSGVRATLTADGAGLDVTAVTAGVWPIGYTVSDGRSDGADSTDSAIVLVTVLAQPPSNEPPTAVPDRVLLKSGRVLNVDVLANDLDPDGDLLAIVGTSAAPPTETGGGVRVSVVDRRLLQVELVAPTDGSPPVGPFTVSYTIDDGQGMIGDDGIAIAHTSTAILTVLVDPATYDQPPTAMPDSMLVRTGDVSSASVTANDIDPDGDRIELVGVNADEATAHAAAGELVAWTTGQKLFVRGGTPGRYTVHYDVVANGKPASGAVSVEVRARPSADVPNGSPTAKALEARAVRGSTIRIKVPVEGIDPDGDAVHVSSVGASAHAAEGVQIAVSDAEPNVLLYTVAPRSAFATDEFTYTVQDAYGGFSDASVRVVVVDVDSTPPVAHDDIWRVRPGRELVVPVLANDVDADDDQIALAELPFFDLEGQPADVPQHPDAIAVIPDGETVEERGRLAATAPGEDEPVLSERYRITDGTSFGDAYLRVIPDPEAPNMAPIAVADKVTAAEVLGQTTVVVPVLDNDYDPDDGSARLTVELPGVQPGVTATTDGTTVEVTLGPDPQLIVYRVTDADPDSPRSAYTTISVPGLENHPPELNALGKDPEHFRLKADDPPLTISIPEIVTDPDGDPGVQLTATEITTAGTGTVTRVDDRTFTFQPNADQLLGYTAQVTFEVIDRPGDDTAKTALLTITIPVDPPGNTPPTVDRAGNVGVPVLDEPVTYDLALLVSDAQNDPLTFALVDQPGGFTITQDGSTVTLTGTDESRSPGQTFPMTFTVTDGKSDPVTGTVTITITRTNKGQPATSPIGPVDAVLNEATAGVNVIAQATNPFPDRPMTITSVSASNGSVSCSANCGQSPIVYTPASIGTATVTYTVQDAAKQTATGTITYVVKGRPLAPGVPQVGEVGDRLVNLTWTAADMQGGTLVKYVVVTDSGQRMESATTSLAFTSGLVNAQPYKFSVYAVNEIGEGAASAFSNTGIPDKVPDPPENPRFTDYGDGTLMLAWDAPSTAGNYSAIKQYRVTVQGGPTQIVPAPTNTLTVTGLSNGTAYTFSVEAQNDASSNGGWGAASGRSVSETPSRFPDPPVSVAAAAAGDGGSARVKVTWSAPANNGGRAIVSYDVCRVQDGTCQNVAATTATFNAATGSDNSFTVVAHNTDRHRDNSDPSAASNVVHGVVTPGAPTITAVASGDHTLTVSSTPGANGGCSSTFTEYSVNGGGSWQASNTITGLTNGTAYTVIARMTLGTGCRNDLGPGASPSSGNSNSMSNTPYGDLRQPSISGYGSGQSIVWSWNASQGDNGRVVSVTIEGGGCPAYSTANGQTIGYGAYSYSVTCTIRVKSNGVPDKTAQATASTESPPRYYATVGSQRTCPQPDFNYTRFHPGDPATCDVAWAAANRTWEVSCYVTKSSSWVYTTWFRRVSDGWYLADGTVSVSGGSPPAC